MSPIRLTDDELEQIFRAAQPLARADRDRFLQTVAERLTGTTIGEGAVFRICHEVQRELMFGNYPEVTNRSGLKAKYSR